MRVLCDSGRQQEWAPTIEEELDPDTDTVVLCHHGMRRCRPAWSPSAKHPPEHGKQVVEQGSLAELHDAELGCQLCLMAYDEHECPKDCFGLLG